MVRPGRGRVEGGRREGPGTFTAGVLVLRRAETRGQAAVESALVVPAHLFLVLGVLQLNLAYHAKLVAEYAVFKAARAGSVYRADCQRMIDAATIALGPTLESHGGSDVRERLARGIVGALSSRNLTRAGTPLVVVQYWLDTPPQPGPFDAPLDPDQGALTLRVRLAYFFEYRVPFAGWLMARYWLAMNTGTRWAASYDPTFPVVRDARQPTPHGGFDNELLSIAHVNIDRSLFAPPLVATWSMRMMSEPLPGKLAGRPFRTCRCLNRSCGGE